MELGIEIIDEERLKEKFYDIKRDSELADLCKLSPDDIGRTF